MSTPKLCAGIALAVVLLLAGVPFVADPFSAGIFSVGLFSIGPFAFGLYTLGLFVLAKHRKTLSGKP